MVGRDCFVQCTCEKIGRIPAVKAVVNSTEKPAVFLGANGLHSIFTGGTARDLHLHCIEKAVTPRRCASRIERKQRVVI
ncbi:hypothetical protein MIMGU_mgv1a017388mg [Erythranthe guttata]|uniref:Uncharacterized protein n=1 Tax=Erythranthe guttata TaxID=4155 RepID=A0A022RVF2_ERYGU|nr:hypothetical protein MIMGU_mgv1a017388mg [Erythranthe guttata]